MLKKKNGKLNAHGGSKTVKECLRLHKGQWELWVNGTVLVKNEKQILDIKNECVRSQQINSKHVIKLIEGKPYKSLSSDKKFEVDKISVYSEKADGTLNNRPRNLGFADLFSLCLTSALGLADIHKAGFIHRDIKFENILFFQKGHLVYAKISDLGLAIETSKAEAGHWAGTRPWTSPEEVLGHNYHQKKPELFKEQCEILKKAKIKPANISHPKGDVYALAKVFYEIFNKYSSEVKVEKAKTEAQSLANYFHKIMHTSREDRITSAELVEYLKITLERLSKEMPNQKWDQIREYCEIPSKQASATISIVPNTGSDSFIQIHGQSSPNKSDNENKETPLRALSILKSNPIQETPPNLQQQPVLNING